MSLPKDPRQLMINLMYLVLTALLALNVSAEILNAFLTLDKSIQESNDMVYQSNSALYKSIKLQAEAYPQFEKIDSIAKQAQSQVSNFCKYVEAIKENLIISTGGLDENQQLVGKKEKDITTRILIKEGTGLNFRDSVLNTRKYLLDLITDEKEKAIIEKSLPLDINPIPKTSDKKNWVDCTFRQMPLAAVLPLLTKYQSDARLAETSILNFLANKIAAKPVHDEYKALIAADKSYLTKGEDLNAEIFLGAYSSTTNNIDVRVNGSKVAVKNGKATFSKSANQLGDHILNVEITERNPLNGKIKKYYEKYHYKVGEKSVTLSADKMNVFYVGVKNPLSVSAAGVPSEEVKVSSGDVKVEKKSAGKYIITPAKPGRAFIRVSGGGLAVSKYEYRVKPIPTPTAKLGNKGSRAISANEIKIYKKIVPHLENFDFDAKCKIVGFDIVKIAKNGDGQDFKNKGNQFSSKTSNLISSAKRGDKYYFEKIKAKCPGDQYSRELNPLYFKIK